MDPPAEREAALTPSVDEGSANGRDLRLHLDKLGHKLGSEGCGRREKERARRGR
jgi:hypothetical protein